MPCCLQSRSQLKRRGSKITGYGYCRTEEMCGCWRLNHLYQLRSRVLAHCVTSPGVAAPHYPLHSLHPSHSSLPCVEGTEVDVGGAAHDPDQRPAHWQQRRMKWGEQRRSQKLRVRGELESPGWRVAVERWSPLLLPVGSSY